MAEYAFADKVEDWLSRVQKFFTLPLDLAAQNEKILRRFQDAGSINTTAILDYLLDQNRGDKEKFEFKVDILKPFVSVNGHNLNFKGNIQVLQDPI
jgi:hypothetical protein